MANTTQKIGLNTYDLSIDNTADFISGMSANMEKIDREVTDRVKINNTPTTVNFIGNDIVKDGLVYSNSNTNSRIATGITPTKNMTIIWEGFVNPSSYIVTSHKSTEPKEGYILRRVSDGRITLEHYINGIRNDAYIEIKNKDYMRVTINIENNKLKQIGINETMFVPSQAVVIPDMIINLHCVSTSFGDLNGMCKNVLIYNRQLTSQEISHNFSILNNTPSINKINDYAISTDADHITDRTGRVQEDINCVFYRNMCKEFTSNGGDITVNNGMDGYLLSATLQGDTKVFKSLKGKNVWSEIPSTETRDTVTYDYKLESTKAVISNNGTKYSFYALLDDKLNNRVITLGSTATKRDTLEIKEDGSAIYTQNTQYNADSSARVDLATPIVTSIDKALVPVILTQLQNQFTFGEGVSPYIATIQVPCTDDIKKSYTQTLLNGFTQTANTATPVVNLLNTGLVRLQMDLTAPATGLNATLFSLPLELRPVTTQRIPVFVNGVCQLATIDKTTGNVNLASVPSASANVYIKSDYRRDI